MVWKNKYDFKERPLSRVFIRDTHVGNSSIGDAECKEM